MIKQPKMMLWAAFLVLLCLPFVYAPYVIGSLSTSDRLVMSFPFNNTIFSNDIIAQGPQTSAILHNYSLYSTTGQYILLTSLYPNSSNYFDKIIMQVYDSTTIGKVEVLLYYNDSTIYDSGTIGDAISLKNYTFSNPSTTKTVNKIEIYGSHGSCGPVCCGYMELQATHTYVYNTTLTTIKPNVSFYISGVNTLYSLVNYTTNIVGEPLSAVKGGISSIIYVNGTYIQNYSTYTFSTWFNGSTGDIIFLSGSTAQTLYLGTGVIEFDDIPNGLYFTAPITNGWNNVILVKDQTNISFYINGQLLNTTEYNKSFDNSSSFQILPTSPTGMLSNFLMYNYALSQSELGQLYNGFNSSLNINVYDEISKQPILTQVILDVISSNVSYSLNVYNGYVFLNNFSKDLNLLRYSSNSSVLREYYINLSNNTNSNVNLYQINDSVSTSITATVLDSINNPVSDAYITALRYFPNNNTYVTVSQIKTDSEGKALLHLEKFNEYYKFTIMYPFGNVVYTTIPAYIINDNIAFQVSLTTSPVTVNNQTLNIVTSGISYNNATGQFTFAFQNVQGTNSQVKLDVYSITKQGRTLLNSSDIVASAGTIVTSINASNNTQYEAQAVVIYLNETTRLIAAKEVYIPESTDQGAYGLFLLIFLTMVLAFTAFYSISLMVVIVPIPLLLLSILGFIAFPVPLAIVLEIGAIIVAIIIGY